MPLYAFLSLAAAWLYKATKTTTVYSSASVILLISRTTSLAKFSASCIRLASYTGPS